MSDVTTYPPKDNAKLLISVKDIKAETWSPPTVADNRAVAMRMFGDLVRDGRTLIGQHPEDFDLFIAGYWDPVDGSVQGRSEFLVHGSDFAQEKQS